MITVYLHPLGKVLVLQVGGTLLISAPSVGASNIRALMIRMGFGSFVV